MQPTRHTVRAAGVRLNVLTLGDPAHPPLLMVHGIRDVAASLLAVAEPLAQRFFVVLPDLRGHGDSDKPGSYAMWQFVYDLHCVDDALSLQRPAIMGHSLGGQIAAHYAALFAADVSRLIIVEGLGPPLRPVDAESQPAARRQRLLELAALPALSRPLPSVEFAAARLLANNPRLSAERADWLARHATATGSDGRLYWKFDPRVGQVWLGGETEQNPERWRAIGCPTLIITAALASEYWRAQMSSPNADGQFSAAVLAERLQHFRHARHLQIDDAGHMVHFDAAPRLAAEIDGFLRSTSR